jgi:hypothetical protein
MSEKQMTRRDFVGTGALVGSGAILVPRVPAMMQSDNGFQRFSADFGSCPRKLEDFLKYIVQRRAAEGLNQMSMGEARPKPVRRGTISNGNPNDMYVAWTAAAAYRYPWSRFHREAAFRERALLLMDTTIGIRADGNWDDGGLNSFFGFHALALAVLWWKETGEVDAQRLQIWTQAVVRAAESALLHLHYGPYEYTALTAQYANPEMYCLAGLAATWKLTGQDRYRVEAAHGLARYDEWTFEGGGLAYFLRSSPVNGYQEMASKSVALYWDLTQDPYALGFMKRMAPYFPNMIHRSGMVTDAENPQIKHLFGFLPNPAASAILAAALGDGTNRFAADAALQRTVDALEERTPSYGKVPVNWYTPQLCTYAATALRIMERHPLPETVDPGARRVFMDGGYRGVRSHWNDFMAATTTRQMSDSVAGAYIADPHERTVPLDSALDGVYFEVIQPKQASDIEKGKSPVTIFSCTEWSPVVNYAACNGLASQSSMSRLFAEYWAEVPRTGDDDRGPNQESSWSSIQHWAVWQDYLVGFSSLRSQSAGGNVGDVARVRWRISPESRKLKILEQTDKVLRFQYGRLQADFTCFDQRGGAIFKPENITEAPRQAWTPLLTRSAPWAAGDYMNVSTVVRPGGAAGMVNTKGFKNGGAAVMLEAGGHKAHVWVTNLTRGTQHFLMDVPAGIDVQTYKRNVYLPPVPPGQPAHAGLEGGEAAIWVLESLQPINVETLMAGIRQSNTRPLPSDFPSKL